jgi:hypothetical protein
MPRLKNSRGLYFYFLYLPKPLQYIFRIALIFGVGNKFVLLLMASSMVWSLFSVIFGAADIRYVLSDLYIDIGLLFWVYNIGIHKIKSTSFVSLNLVFLFTLFVIYMEINDIDYTINDWRGTRLFSFFNGAAGIVLMSFALNFMLWKKNLFWIVILTLLLILSKSRMALAAPLISYIMGQIIIKYPTMMRILTILFMILMGSSFIWLPLSGIDGTGRFFIWLNMLEQSDLICWYGDVFDVLQRVSNTEDQLHNLYLHLWLSRGIYIYGLIGVLILNKLFILIKQGKRSSYSTLILFLLHSATDNVVLYPFLIPFII